MSKNIEDIVESVLPLCPKGGIDRIHLAQALTEKKLVVPMSEESIRKIIFDAMAWRGDERCFNEDQDSHTVAKAIYERQFKGEL